MTGISFIVVTSGTNDDVVNQLIDSIEVLAMPEYEVIVVGGLTTTVNRKNTIHIPFDENQRPAPWLTRKKNLGSQASKYEVNVIMHDYHAFDPDWYIEFEKFGTDWDICVQQIFMLESQGGQRANGWRMGSIPEYPEIPNCMTVPWDIDCFVPYMGIQGAYWVCKRSVMQEEPLNETLLKGQNDDVEWWPRVIPGWQGQNVNQVKYKIVANPNCIIRLTKEKPTYPGNPDWAALERSLESLWDWLRAGNRRPGVYHYERSPDRVCITVR